MKQKRKLYLSIAVAGIVAIIWVHQPGSSSAGHLPEMAATSGQAAVPEKGTDGAPLPDPDHADVFRRAFWKHPAAGDRIHHAQRIEWSGERGVESWQWFIAVDPSAQLADHLFVKDAFRMKPAPDTSASFAQAPSWFPQTPEGMEVSQSADGQMTWLVRRADGRLFATGQGGGFRAAQSAPERAAPADEMELTGRLPHTPPPDPRQLEER